MKTRLKFVGWILSDKTCEHVWYCVVVLQREAVMCAELEELRDENRRLERDFTSMEQSLRERINMLEVKAHCNRHLASPPATAPCKKV